MSAPLQYHLTPLQLLAYRESTERITRRWTNTWASGSHHGNLRILSEVRPFSFKPFIDRYYGAAYRLIDEPTWRRGLMLDQAWMFDRMRALSNPHTVDHYLLAFLDGASPQRDFRHAVKSSFLLPQVTEAPLPPLINGRYRDERTHLVPLDHGHPYLAVLSAYQATGDWDLHTWGEILYGDIPLVLCLDVRTLPRQQARWSARMAYNRFLQVTQKRSKDPDMERARDAAGTAMDLLYSEALHLVSYHMLVTGSHLEELHERCLDVEQALSGLLHLERLPLQLELLKFFTTTPTSRIRVPERSWNVLSSGMAASTPFGISRQVNSTGICFGVGPTDLPVMRSLWQEMLGGAGHAVIIGKTGAGKTTCLFAWLLRHVSSVDEPCQVLFADPASNGKRLCDAVGPEGSSYLALGGNETINPLDVVSTDLAEQVAAVARKLMIVLGKTSGERGNLQVHPREFSELEEAALDLALQKLYGPAGEYLKPMSTGKRLPPLLSDLATTLREVIAAEGLSEAQPLARHLTYFLRTTKGRIFNQQTSIAWQFNAAVIAYSFEQVPDNRLPIYYLLLFEALDRYVRTRPRTAKRFIACIDEFKLMAQVPALRRYVEGFTRWWRQRRGAMWTADQTLSTYLDDPSTLANVAVKFFFKMDEADLQFLQQVYGAVIAPEEIDIIRNAREGQCLALFGTHPEEIYVPLTGIEHAAFLGPLEEVAHAPLADPDERGDSTLTAALDARADRAVASVEGHLSESQEGRD